MVITAGQQIRTQLNANSNIAVWGNVIYNVKAYGALGDGVTDDTAAINAAIATVAAAGGGTVLFPPGSYYVTSTLTVSRLVTLRGFDNNSDVSSGVITIVGSLSLTPIILLDGSAGNGSTAIKNISITRQTGTIPSGATGIKVQNTDYALIENVTIFRHAVGYEIDGDLGILCKNVLCYGITETYTIINNVVQVTFENCSFGRNGGELAIGPATTMIQISGVADTITFLRCQINPTISGVTNALYFKGFTSSNGIIKLDDCHIENTTNIITSDSLTTFISRLMIENCTISSTAVTNPFVSLNAATSAGEWKIEGNHIQGTTNISKGSVLNLSNNRFSGAVTLALDSAVVIGNSFNTGVTLNGAWKNLVFVGNEFDGIAQVITDNSTGIKTILGNVSTTGYTNNNLLAEDFIQLGSGTPFGIKKYTGTTDGSGSAVVAHGIGANLITEVLSISGFYKGGSGEAQSLTPSYVDGANIVLTGGTATTPYRVTLIYNNVPYTW